MINRSYGRVRTHFKNTDAGSVCGKNPPFYFHVFIITAISLLEKAGLYSIAIFFLVASPLLSLDRIGIELQKPFVKNSLSHLPLDAICEKIKLHCLDLRKQAAQVN